MSTPRTKSSTTPREKDETIETIETRKESCSKESCSKESCSKEKEKEYLYINDILYDVSGFTRKHPGGSLIRTMLWNEKDNDPKDASQHFREFHYRQNRSTNSVVKKLLNEMPRAPPELQQKAREIKERKDEKSIRDREMIKDFVKMRQELEKNGFFEPSYSAVAIRLILITMGWIIGYYLIGSHYFLGLVILSCSLQQCGWLHHEGGHRSLTGNVAIDGAIEYIVINILFSSSSNFWNYQHNQHHANTQHEEYDIDLKTLPLLAFDRAVLEEEEERGERGGGETNNKSKDKDKESAVTKFAKKKISFWIRHQWLTFFLTNLIIYAMWRFFIHLRYEFRKRNYHHVAVSLTFCVVGHIGILVKFSQLSLFWAIVTYLAYSSFGLWLLLIHFAVSHTFTGVHDGRYNWVETASHYTVNVRDHWLVNIVMGLLNFQIEHHLFPQMSHRNARRAAPYVRELFKKYQLPYYEYGYWHGFFLVLQNLYHVGHGLPDIRPTVTNRTDKSKKLD